MKYAHSRPSEKLIGYNSYRETDTQRDRDWQTDRDRATESRREKERERDGERERENCSFVHRIPVLCCVADMDSQVVHTPDSWSRNPSGDHVLLISLEAKDAEYKNVDKTFNATIGNSAVKVTAVRNTTMLCLSSFSRF